MRKKGKTLDGFVSDEQRLKLLAIKISTVEKFRLVASNGSAETIKQALNIDDAELSRLKNKSDLFMLDGVKGKTCKLLNEIGIETLDQLAWQDARYLAFFMKDTNSKQKIMKINHDHRKIRKMILHARGLMAEHARGLMAKSMEET